ncbi:MAG: hypothetical protein R2714_16225 [Microthrixaceae bacterium]
MANVTVEPDRLPGRSLEVDRVPGHWLLARLGKTAPGLGSTTELLLERAPASYTGVDRDPDAAARFGGSSPCEAQ